MSQRLGCFFQPKHASKLQEGEAWMPLELWLELLDRVIISSALVKTLNGGWKLIGYAIVLKHFGHADSLVISHNSFHYA